MKKLIFALLALFANTLSMFAAPIVVELTEAGTLSVEVLSKTSLLTDVTELKIKGPINTTDYATLKNMTNLVTLDLSETVTSALPNEQFRGKKIENITLPACLRTIGNSCFYESKLKSIDIVENCKLGTYTFYNCDNLVSVTLPSTMTAIPTYCFYDCDNLETIKGGTAVEIVNTYAFYSCNKLAAFPFDKVRTIGESAFRECDVLQEAIIPEATSLGINSFYSCDGLKKVVIGDKCETIRSQSFYYCTALKEITLPASLTKIENYLLYNCKALTTITCNAPAPPVWYDSFCMNNVSRENTTIKVPSYAMVSYKSANNWSGFQKFEATTQAATDILLKNSLELASASRIQGAPNLTMDYKSHLGINGNNEQKFGTFTYRKGEFYSSKSYNGTSYYNVEPTLICRGNSVKADNTVFEFWTDASYWHFICLPFDVNYSDITTSNDAAFAIRYYDGAERAKSGTGFSWKNMEAGSVMKANQGYIIQVSKETQVLFPATAETRNQIFANGIITTALDANKADDSANAGWNLVGNPFPAYYDIYRMDYTAPITRWNYRNRTYTAYSPIDDELVLRPFEGFFVQCPSTISSIAFAPSGRQQTTAIDHSEAAKAKAFGASQRTIVNLCISNNASEDRTRIVVNEGASEGFDANEDATKMMSMSEDVAQIFSIAGNMDFAINEAPHQSGEVKVGMYIPADGTYTLSAPQTSAEVMIKDAQTDTTVSLTGDNTYTFSAEKGNIRDRFTLLLAEATGISSIIEGNNYVRKSANGIIVGGNGKTKVSIYSISGALVSEQTAEAGTEIQLPAGAWIVRSGSKAVKINK